MRLRLGRVAHEVWCGSAVLMCCRVGVIHRRQRSCSASTLRSSRIWWRVLSCAVLTRLGGAHSSSSGGATSSGGREEAMAA